MSPLLARIGLIIAAVCCCVTTAGSRSRPASPSVLPQRSPAVSRFISAANEAYKLADYASARRLYSQALQYAQRDSDDAASLHLGIGNCDLMTHRYASALQAYNEAAHHADSNATLVPIATGRVSVYRRMGNKEAAMEAMRQVERLLGSNAHPMALLQAANVWRDLDMQRAGPLYRAAIEGSSAAGDREATALALNQYGLALLFAGDLAGSETALTEAFRIRRLTGSRQLQTSYFYLARLKRTQGDLRSAANLLDRALNERQQQIPPPYLHHEQGVVERLVGHRRQALAAFERALISAREWRLQMLSSQDFRVSAELGLRQIYSDFINCAMEAYMSSGDQTAMHSALAASEQARSVLFEETTRTSDGYPPEYWGALARYQRALADSLADNSPFRRGLVRQYRLELADIEAAHGGTTTRQSSHKISETRLLGFPLTGLQRNLSGPETLISFHLGDSASFRWEVSRNGITARALPGRDSIAELVRRFRRALESRDASAGEIGARLYAALFGGLQPETEASSDWILSLDGPLFELPFAALPGGGKATAFLVESRSLRIVPGLGAASEAPGGISRVFVGLGDPVYNTADPRWKHGNRPERPGRMLARLPGSARELRTAAAAWANDADPELLTGSRATASMLHSAILRRPAVVHIASHVIKHPSAQEQVLIALGLRESGEAEYLGPAEIASWRSPVGLVTLSGCGSGEGAALPGLGLFGLTRAWLLMGARSVMATYWPVPDDDGRLVQVLYGRLGSRKDIGPREVARALRQAQLTVLRSEGSQAHPAYWASFFVMGKE